MKSESGRPVTMKTVANVTQLAAVVKENHRVGCQMIEVKIGIPKTIVQRILHDNWKKKKEFAQSFCLIH